MRFWCEERRRCGNNVDQSAGLFDEASIIQALDDVREDKRTYDASKDNDPTKPTKLKNLSE
jgi:hypothetical protein